MTPLNKSEARKCFMKRMCTIVQKKAKQQSTLVSIIIIIIIDLF